MGGNGRVVFPRGKETGVFTEVGGKPTVTLVELLDEVEIRMKAKRVVQGDLEKIAWALVKETRDINGQREKPSRVKVVLNHELEIRPGQTVAVRVGQLGAGDTDRWKKSRRRGL